MMRVDAFISGLEKAENANTCYLMGGFGCRLKSSGGDWYNKEYGWNKNNASIIQAHMDTMPVTFGFDCVCLIKGVLWGFNALPTKAYGGAVYQSNGVPDMTIAKLAASCPDFSTDWSKDPEVGEIVFYDANYSHVGVYVENGEVIESTPAWKCGVQRTLLPDRLNPKKLPVRKWWAHGHTSYVDYKLPIYNTPEPSTPEVPLIKMYEQALTQIQELRTENTQLKTKVAELETKLAQIKKAYAELDKSIRKIIPM